MSQPTQVTPVSSPLAASWLRSRDSSRTLAWLPAEALQIDLADPAQRRFGDYELIERIGEGGMGVVYRARQLGLERDVAIKLLAAGPGASPAFVERFRREARSAARMQHPNIVEIYEFGRRGELDYFSMRLIEGRSLAERLAADGPLQPTEAAKLLRTLAEAVDYAHRLGVLHLDLKPANVLLDANGTPLIADFGLARHVDAEHEGNEISGTPSYMAPEQARGDVAIAATDIYGLGAILYECLAGRPPFAGIDAQTVLERVLADAPAELPRTVPADLAAICRKCLAKDAGQRYASAGALADDLRRFTEGRAVSVRPLNVMQRLRLWARREPRLATTTGVAALAVLLGIAATALSLKLALDQLQKEVQRQAALRFANEQANRERDRARVASEIGAFLYVHGGDDSTEAARALIDWLHSRWPNDERRQAEALAVFAEAVGDEDADKADALLLTIIDVLGTDYRRRAIASLQKQPGPHRALYSALLAWDTDIGPGPGFEQYLRQAVAEAPNDVFTWHVASTYCPNDRCGLPQAAEELVRLDPDNAYHWLVLVMQSRNPARRRQALHEAASRPRLDDHLGANYGTVAQAVHAAAVPVPVLLARPLAVLSPNGSPEANLGLAEAYRIPIVGWQILVRYCLPEDLGSLPPDMRADCLAVGTRMARSEGGLITRMIGVAIARNLAMGTPLAEEMKQVRVRYQYLRAMDSTLTARQRMGYPAAAFLHDITTAGEMAAMQRRVEHFGLPGAPPADWRPASPNEVLTTREVGDRMASLANEGERLVAAGKYVEALRTLTANERDVREYYNRGIHDQWRLVRFQRALGRARAGLGQYSEGETQLLGAWEIASSFGPASPESVACARDLVSLYTAWDATEPGHDHGEQAANWRRKLAEGQEQLRAATR